VIRIPISAAVLLLAAVPSLGQTFTTTTADVFLQSCGTPTKVFLVPNGDEIKSHALTYVGPEHWIVRDLPSFNAHGARASLRLGGARTTCATSKEARDPHDADKWIAVFRFDCTQERFWSSLSIETTPPTVPMQYKRVMMSDPGCVDSRAKITGMAEITDVAVYNESIYVNLGDYDPLRPYTDYAVAIDKGIFGPQALSPGTFAFPRTMVLTDLTLRRSKNSPTISDNLRSVRGRDLIPFDKIKMTVK
jgi:hypothetical protein